MANLKHVVTDLHQVYLTEMEAKIKPQIGSSASSSESGEKKSAAGGGGEDSIKKAARQLAYDTRYKARREGIPLERAFSQSSANSKASAPVKDAAKAMLFSGPKEEFEVDEATAMAKRGYDEAPIRQKIAKSTGGGEAADRASALEKKSTFGDAKKAKARQDLARKQRGDFRKTTSSSPGLHGYAHKSDDAGVKAKQAARGAQRSALTPAERKNLNMGDEVAQTGDNLQELKKGDKEMVRITPKKGYGKGYVRFADRKKQSELRKNPQIQSVTGTNYGEPYEGKYKTKPGEKNTVGDKDGDGTKEPNSHEYAGVKDKAIKTAMKKDAKKKDIKASFSNWRSGLTESQLMEISGEEKNKKITEKGVKNTVVINPELKEAVAGLGGEVLDISELTQEQVEEILMNQITENLATLEKLGIDIQEISSHLALTASQKADNERRKSAVAGDKTRAAEKARQASAIYKGVGPRKARERRQEEEVKK
jgi:hypothetical protein